MERNDGPNIPRRPGKTRRMRVPRAANDNWIDVSDDLPESLSVEDRELDILETYMSDILTGMVAANDN
jgi:hypothetical protein